MFQARRKSFVMYSRLSFSQAKTILRSSSSVKRALKYREGDKLLNFAVREVQEIPELNLAAVRLQHEKTGADYLHIARDDKNNLFSVALRTTPQNSTGVPHILEHLSLCGSHVFPCRDPFFKMLNRSLSTFMNAFTGCDYTMYPFSTQNAKDFENLLRVYLDAVFFPCLRERDFNQEGWRLEHQDIHDRTSPIMFKGVVFNEMKGAFSDSSQYYAQHLQNKLLPSHTYSYVSGGDPLHIPNLTWESLKQFHSEHYHPSNSRFFSYGDLPLESHLKSVENLVLNKFSKINLNNEVVEEKRWSEPREALIHCKFDPMAADPSKQTVVSVSYMLDKITNTYDSFALSILGYLLIDGPNAPFYQTLLEPGIGADYSPSTGYDGSTKQSYFSVGLREIHESDVNKVKEIIESTFDKVIREGFPQERIEGILHNVELSTKHQTSNFGLRAVMGVNPIWNHGGNPISSLKVNDHVQWFREKMKENPHFLQDLTVQFFKKNPHKLTLMMTPCESFEKSMQEEELKLLESKVTSLTEADKEHIFNEGVELAKYQQKVEDVSCLPSLHIKDVEKVMKKTSLQNVICDGVSVQLCEQPTNEVVYFRALSTVKELTEDLQKLLPLFSIVVTKMGAGSRNYKELDQEAELTTGELQAGVHVTENVLNTNLFEKGIVFSSYCLEKNLDRMMALWQDIFNRLLLEDKDRLSQLIKMTAADFAQGISHQGHLYSMRRASSCLSACAQIREQISGLTQVSFMKKLAEMSDYDEVIEKLKHLSKIILKKDSLRCAINASVGAMPSAVKQVETFLTSLSGQCLKSKATFEEHDFTAASQKMHFVLPFAVNYLGKSVLTVPFDHKDSASLRTAAKLLSSKYLHREIREKGGAYGGGATVNNGGAFMFYSYRDPNVTQTLNSFASGTEWLLNGGYTEEDISEAKLGVFSAIDHPIPPGKKGMSHFLDGISDDMKQQLRGRLFNVTRSDIQDVTNRYLVNSAVCGITLIGPKGAAADCGSDWIIHEES